MERGISAGDEKKKARKKGFSMRECYAASSASALCDVVANVWRLRHTLYKCSLNL